MRSAMRLCVLFVAALIAGAVFDPHAALARGSAAGELVRPATAVTVADLPPEARLTLGLIKRGGPFAYERDGVVFGNLEKLLPLRERGYYREYTVRTPGISSRGARRIVVGREGESYYTDDHYARFRRIRE